MQYGSVLLDLVRTSLDMLYPESEFPHNIVAGDTRLEDVIALKGNYSELSFSIIYYQYLL